MASTKNGSRKSKGKRILVEECDKISVGVDTHKVNFNVCLWSFDGDYAIKRWVQPSDPEALMRSLRPLREKITHIAYEAGPTGFVLARALQADGWPVIVTSPADVPTGRNEAKSDKRDAGRLGKLAGKGMLPECWIPSVEEEDNRRLVRVRGRILCDKSRTQVRIKSLLLCHGIGEPAALRHWTKPALEQLRKLPCSPPLRLSLNAYISELEHLLELLRALDQELSKLAKRAEYRTDVELLRSVPGVGELTSLVFIVEMGCRGRFDDRLSLSKYQGLSPEVRSTGDKRDELNVTNSGNRRLRTTLVEAAWRWVGKDERAKALFRRMLVNTGCSNKAIVAVARKLGIIMWRIRETQMGYNIELTQHETAV